MDHERWAEGQTCHLSSPDCRNDGRRQRDRIWLTGLGISTSSPVSRRLVMHSRHSREPSHR
jgi:hypothetical protein